MKINWRAVFGSPVLVEFMDGKFGVRRGCCRTFYQYLGLNDDAKFWWCSEDSVAKYSHASRERAEQRLVSLYKRKHKATDVKAVHPTNIKALIAEHLLTQASCTKEDPLGQQSKVNWAQIPPVPTFQIPSIPILLDQITTEHEAKMREYERRIFSYSQLAQAAMSAIHQGTKMSRGIRSNTLDRVLIARERDPMGVGPLLGEYAVRHNITPSTIGELVGTHEQTVLRWIFGQSEIQAYWLPAVLKLLGMLIWMRNTNAVPLMGNKEAKDKMLTKYAGEFRKAVKSSSRTLKSAA